MYQIALCDDMEPEREQIEKFLAEYTDRNQAFMYQIEKYGNAQELLDRIRAKEGMPDLLLMDIFMSGKTGIEAVQELRAEGVEVPVIFLTSSTEYALKAYGVDALQYLVKPLDREKVFHALDMFFDKESKRKEKPLMFKVSGGIRQVDAGRIIYCETERNYQILHLADDMVKVRMTGGELYAVLENYSGFVRCGSSYIFNLNHVVAVDKDEIRMDNGGRIFLPRNRAAEFKKMYFAFYFGRG